MKELFIKLIKTLFFNIIGIFILYKSNCYYYEHNDLTSFIGLALIVLIFISIYFIRVNFLKPTDKEIADAAISLFLYVIQRKQGTIEENERAEYLLKDHPIGEVVKEFINYEVKIED